MFRILFEVWLEWFWKKFGPFFINKVHKQFGFWWCLRGSKFGFGPKWDVRMCWKFNPLRFRMFEVWFFDVCSTSSSQQHLENFSGELPIVVIANVVEVEQTSKNQTLNILNLRGLNFEHIQRSSFGPKPNFKPLKHHQKMNCLRTLLIKNGPNFFQNHQNQTSNMSEHVILAKKPNFELPEYHQKPNSSQAWNYSFHL